MLFKSAFPSILFGKGIVKAPLRLPTETRLGSKSDGLCLNFIGPASTVPIFSKYDGRGQCLDLRIGEHSTTPVHGAITNCPYGLGYVCSKLFTKHGFVDREARGLLIDSIAGWKGYIGVASCADNDNICINSRRLASKL